MQFQVDSFEDECICIAITVMISINLIVFHGIITLGKCAKEECKNLQCTFTQNIKIAFCKRIRCNFHYIEHGFREHRALYTILHIPFCDLV